MFEKYLILENVHRKDSVYLKKDKLNIIMTSVYFTWNVINFKTTRRITSVI